MNIEPGFSPDFSGGTDPDSAYRDSQRRRALLTYVVAGAVALFCLMVALHFLRREAPVVEPAPRVTVVVPGRQVVTRTITATGTLAARREMPVGVAGEGGMVTRVLVEPGDWVRAGQVLAYVDASVQVQQAGQLRAQIAAARADAALAESELHRAQVLVGRGFVSQADVDRKMATRDAAQARVAVAQAQLGEVSARIGRLSIRSPAAGLVLTRSVEPGQVVGPGNGALFRVAKGGEMELRARMTDSDLAQLALGDAVDVIPVGAAVRFVGHVWQLSPVVDPMSRQGEARIQLAYDKALRPGSFASAEIRSGTMRVPLLAESAVMSDDGGNFVYVVGADDKVVRRDVKVGPVSSHGLPILSGLQGGEKVVLSAGAFLAPGDPVIPVVKTAGR